MLTILGGTECEITNQFVEFVQLFNLQLNNETTIAAFKYSYGQDLAYALNITVDHISFVYVGPPRGIYNFNASQKVYHFLPRTNGS